MENGIIGIGGLGGDIRVIGSSGSPNTNLRRLIDEGNTKGNTKMSKVDSQGTVRESNGLNTIGTGVMVDITV
jgi:hypothetical protein